MKAPYFIEILSRAGEVQQRQRVTELPLHLGRGYDNDFILDDAHSAARHAVLEADQHGQLVLRDLGSRNGIVHRGKRQERVALDGETVVRIGHTRLRVRGADYAVAPEQADTTMHGWEGAAPALLGMALIALFTAVEHWLSDVDAVQAVRYLLVITSGLGAGLVWSSGWALANRLFSGHARLGRHLFILGSALCVVGVWRVLSTVLAYAWSAEWLTGYGNLVVVAIVAGAIYFHMRTIQPRHPRRLAGLCTVLALAGCGLTVLTNLQSTGRAADELYMSTLLPPSVRHSPDHSVNEFLSAAARLQAQADAARTHTVKNGDEDEDSDDQQD